MTDDAIVFTTGTESWEILKRDDRYAVCKFSNERMRITSEGVLMGGALRTLSTSLETHWFDTLEFAQAAKRAFEKLDAIGENFGRKRIPITFTQPMTVGAATMSFYQPTMSNWQCYLFGNTPAGQGMVYRPAFDNVPNFFVRWCMKIMLGCTWVKDKS